MADFAISDPSSHTDEPRVYKGPFGPVEIHQTKMPDLSFTLAGSNVPPSRLDLGTYAWLPRRVIKSRKGKPLIAQVGDLEVTIRNRRRPCLAGFRDPTLGAQANDRRYVLRLKQFGSWKVIGSDGSVRAMLRKQRWIDDSCDALDVAVILLLRSLGVVYEGLVTQGASGAAMTVGG
ncbi:MAG TPA: hypothetical protein VGH24_09895 [Solirubrobacteraceae bacterium]|jgi:hypothetical protein